MSPLNFVEISLLGSFFRFHYSTVGRKKPLKFDCYRMAPQKPFQPFKEPIHGIDRLLWAFSH